MWRKREIGDTTPIAMSYAEDFALDSALRFLLGQPWNVDKDIGQLSDMDGLDAELIWLTTKVLFGPAVVYVATGKSV